MWQGLAGRGLWSQLGPLCKSSSAGTCSVQSGRALWPPGLSEAELCHHGRDSMFEEQTQGCRESLEHSHLLTTWHRLEGGRHVVIS